MIPDFDLTPLNTMGLRSHAKFGVRVTSLEDLQSLATSAREKGLPLHIIGGGSNLLPQEEVPAVVGLMAMLGKQVIEDDSGNYLVTAQAGEDWAAFVAWTVGNNLPGLENLAAIPGTVGASPIQNIGAYGLELADRFHSLTAYDAQQNQTRTFTKPECEFAYRQSIFKKIPGQFVVLSVTLALPKAWQPVLTYAGLNTLPEGTDAATIHHRVVTLRSEKLPDWRQLGNAGSFFHNPVVTPAVADTIPGVPRYPQPDGTVKLSAAWLIEACNLKGYRMGPVGVYSGHALILVNHGGATYADIAALATHIQQAVHQRFAITLTQEPIVL